MCNRNEELKQAIYDFAIRVLKGGAREAEIDMLPNLLAVTHIMDN